MYKRQILTQLLADLQNARKGKLLWSLDIVALNQKIANVTRQDRLLAQLKQQGLVDPDIFISRRNELAEQLRATKLEKERFLESEEDQTIQRTQELLEALELSLIHISTGEDLTVAVSMDRFEWADYALSYVLSVSSAGDVDPSVRQQADEYAERLAEVDSNTIPIYLAQYYFLTGRTQEALDMVEQYVDYVSSDPETWQTAFDLLEQYEQDTDDYRTGVQYIAWKLDTCCLLYTSGLLQQDIDTEDLANQARNIFEELQAAQTGSGAGDATYTDLLDGMDEMIRDIQAYAELKSSEETRCV